MINLLPPKYKEDIRFEENLSLAFVLEIIFLAFLLSFVLVLFSIKFSISGRVDAEKITLKNKNKEFSQIKPVEELLNSTNKQLAGSESFYKNRFDLTDFMERIANLLPDDVYLNSFSYQIDKKKVNLSGFSPTVDALLEFKDNLEKQKDFGEFYFPTAVWLEQANINFDISFKIGIKYEQK